MGMLPINGVGIAFNSCSAEVRVVVGEDSVYLVPLWGNLLSRTTDFEYVPFLSLSLSDFDDA